MKYLITGGAGFIGSHLAENLLSMGHHVCILDDLSSGVIGNVIEMEENSKFSCVIDSVENRVTVENLVKECDVVFHLAAAVGVNKIIDEPTKTIQTNIIGTEVVLHYANKYRKKILITSTSEVYGKSTEEAFSEYGDSIIGPSYKRRWAYATSKLLDEFLALAYWHETRLPVFIVRLFNTVGPKQTGRYGMVIPRLVKQSLANEDITVYGTGKQTRCFTYVKDVVDILIKVVNSPHAMGEVFNIGSNEEISIENLAMLIKKKTGSSSSIKYISYEEAYGKYFEDMDRRFPDLTKLRRVIGSEPRSKLDDILDNVIAYMKESAIG